MSWTNLFIIHSQCVKEKEHYLYYIIFYLWFECDHFTNTLHDNVNPLVWKNRDGEISPVVTQAHFIFPSHGLAVMVKKNFPSRGFAAPGEIFVSPVAAPPLLGKLFFTNPAKPFLGKIKCAFRDSWGNFYFPSRGFATPRENPLPYFSTPRDWAIPR